jgi:hypothetical protein
MKCINSRTEHLFVLKWFVNEFTMHRMNDMKLITSNLEPRMIATSSANTMQIARDINTCQEQQ